MAGCKASCQLIFILLWLEVAGQFSPQAGLPGSNAVPAASAEIKFWASAAEIVRGYVNLSDTGFYLLGSNRVGFGSTGNALGPAGGTMDVVSLGDGGQIILRFDVEICDGPGWDFAVFENGFRHPSDSNLAFLELAFVEVSSDGQHFYRFPAISLTPTDRQVGTFDFLDARKIHNLAGKYVAGWGVPFDLAELSNVNDSFLDLSRIRFIKLVDVVGSIDSRYGSRDSKDNLINDPFPTPFVSGGFDLDAVGVRNFRIPESQIKIFPNPVSKELFVLSKHNILFIKIYNSEGILLFSQQNKSNFVKINLSNFQAGLYFCVIKTETGLETKKFIKI